MPAFTREDMKLMEVMLEKEHHEKYRQIIGKIQYLTAERDDIPFPTKECSKDLAKPSECSWKKMKTLVRYLQATKKMEHHIFLEKISDHLDTYVDANFANNLDTRRSTSAGTIWFGTGRICSWARTQKVIALSTAEAEFNAIVAGICEAIFVVNLLKEFLEMTSVPK